MTEQEFRNKYVGKAVHCDTKEKAKELWKLAHSFGWKWKSGESLIEYTHWCFHQEVCYILHLDKTTGWASYGFYKSRGCEIVKFESEGKKVKKTKKVFDLGLYVDERKKQGMSLDNIMDNIKRWALECHGLTEEEMNKKNKLSLDIWMREVEVDVQLTAQEIEVLKALKVLGLNWIARDEDGDLYAHRAKPDKEDNDWYSDDVDLVKLDSDLFAFIIKQDEEPTSIDGLYPQLQLEI